MPVALSQEGSSLRVRVQRRLYQRWFSLMKTAQQLSEEQSAALERAREVRLAEEELSNYTLATPAQEWVAQQPA